MLSHTRIGDFIHMNSYKSSAELKGMAKEQLFGKYSTVAGPALLLGIISLFLRYGPEFIIGTNTVLQLIIYYLVGFIFSLFAGIFASGRAFFYLKLTCGQPVSVGDIFYGFQAHTNKSLFIQLVLSVAFYICLIPANLFNSALLFSQNGASLLLLSILMVIGAVVYIIIRLILSQAYYLLQDFPQYSAKELMQMSCQIMRGHKGRLFYLIVTFLPLYLLGILSCCIAFIWLNPYMDMVLVNFYMDLMKNRNSENKNSGNNEKLPA